MTTARTITFGDVAENGPGMEHIGSKASFGLSVEELEQAKANFEKYGYKCYLLDLASEEYAGFDIKKLPNGNSISIESSKLLVVRKGVRALASCEDGVELVNAEQEPLEPDKKAWMRGEVKNKRARWNLCFADKAQDANISKKKGTILSFSDLPILSKCRENLKRYFGSRCERLNAELNVYYDIEKCGIGFHGDAERNITIGMRLGVPIPFHYQWFYKSQPVGNRIGINLKEGDIYAMGAKAVGTDWKRSSILTLRHAAGAPYYLKINKPNYKVE